MITKRPIVRTWSGTVPLDRADSFQEHLVRNAVTEARGIEGFLGATVLRLVEQDRVRFTLLSTWSDWDAVRQFSGDDSDAARAYPGDDQFDLRPDLHVTHYECAYQI